jgi:hypothetical protein
MTTRFVGCSALLLAIGCATPEVVVRVDSYPGADGLSRAAPLCFQTLAEGSVSQRTRHREVVAACSSAARDVGLRVVAEGTAGCRPTRLSWQTTNGTVFPEDTRCSLFGCKHNVTVYYGKMVSLAVATDGVTAFESRADLTTPNPDFADTTAYVACHAIFEEYPNRVANKRYTVAEPKR